MHLAAVIERLTQELQMQYPALALETNSAGLDIPEASGKWPLNNDVAFFASGAPSMGGAGQGPQGHRCLPGISTCSVAAHPFDIGEAVHKSNRSKQTMNTTTLIPTFNAVINDEPAQLCNARELHTNLQIGRDFVTWIKERIEHYGFVEGEDFILCSPNPGSKKGRGGHNRTDYHLTLDMAKELAMIENNDIGREIRRYLIRLEKKVAASLLLPAIINRVQLGEMSQRMADRFPDGKDKPYAWSRFNNHFRLASYKDLPAGKFDEALAYIDQMPTKDKKQLAVTVNTENASISDADILRAATAELMKPGRMFLTIFGKGTTGQPHPILYPVSEGARMLTDDEIIQRISKADGFPAPMIPALISAAASRLQARLS
jgi:phage anti-repressor protein